MIEFEAQILRKQPKETESVRLSQIYAPVTDEFELKYLGWMLYTDQMNPKEMAERYKLDIDYVRSLKRKHIDGSGHHKGRGRPRKLNKEDAKHLEQVARDAHENSRCITTENFLDEVNKHLVEKGETKACDRVCLDFLKENGFRQLSCQHKNNNRIKAESDPRNVLNASVAFLAITSGMKPDQIWNLDATQLKITHGSEKIYCILPPNRNTSIPVTSEESSNQLDAFYKYTALVNASGYISDPYLLFSDNNYSANDEKHFEHYEIPGVRINAGPLCVGILKKRGGNDASWTWLLSEYIIDQFNKYRKMTNIEPDDKFEECGLFPLDYVKTLECGYSNKKYFSNPKVRKEYYKLVEENIEYFVDCFLENGVLEDNVMDERGIPKAEEEEKKKDKDDRVARSNRCLILTGNAYLNYLKIKREKEQAAQARTSSGKKEKADRELVLKEKLANQVEECKKIKKDLKDSTNKIKDSASKIKNLENEVSRLNNLIQSLKADQEPSHEQPKKKQKSHTSASDRSHQFGSNCDNNGKIAVNCCANKNVDRNQVTICINCNNFSTCRVARCQHYMDEHLETCKK